MTLSLVDRRTVTVVSTTENSFFSSDLWCLTLLVRDVNDGLSRQQSSSWWWSLLNQGEAIERLREPLLLKKVMFLPAFHAWMDILTLTGFCPYFMTNQLTLKHQRKNYLFSPAVNSCYNQN